MKSLLLKLGEAIGLDSAIINVVTARLWSLLAGPLSIFLIAHRLSPQEQGFYYTYGSVLGMRVFVELGLIYVILQFASHEMSGLRWEDQRLVGDETNRARLGDLLRKSLQWYAVVSALVLVSILPGGLWFLGRDPVNFAAVAWKGPWIGLCMVVALSTTIAPITSIIEGSGRVAEVTRVHMWEGMATGIALWIGLLSGWRLYSPLFSAIAALSVTIAWLLATKRKMLSDLLFHARGASLSWWQEILPMQWRTAVVWIFGYFANQFFTPAIFKTHGAELAGKVGMTLNLINVIAAVGLSWMQTKAAPFGLLVANREWPQLDRIFFRTLNQAMGVYLFGCTCLLGVMQFLHWLHHPIADRLLDFPTTVIFMAALGFNLRVFCRSVYLRAHKAEPYYVLELVNGAIVGIILFVVVPRAGLSAVALAYLLAACLPVQLISIVIFQSFRRRHHV